MRRISIEDHFLTEAYISYLRSNKGYPRLEIMEDEKHRKFERWYRSAHDYREQSYEETSRKLDIGDGRLKIMDAAGIDMQVLSLSAGIDQLDASDATAIVKKSNDELAKAVNKHPKRLAGFAALATQDPKAAAKELERAVKELGLKGAKINSHVNGEHLDDEKYWVIFEKAHKIGVPVFVHPMPPSPDMLKPYVAYPGLAGSMWGSRSPKAVSPPAHSPRDPGCIHW
jgi:predicted TIM-barrel fold metal-dependent hydrolase